MIPVANIFASYTFTDEEIRGALLSVTPVLEAILQTRLADLATSKVNLKVDSTMPASFIQEEAFLTGSITELSGFLNQIREAKEQWLQNTSSVV